MRRKKLLTVALCSVLVMAACAVSQSENRIQTGIPGSIVCAAETGVLPLSEEQETKPSETQAPETQPTETEPPQTEPSQTEPPQTQAPETQPPTEPGETEPGTEQQPVTPPQTEPSSETQPPSEPETPQIPEMETESDKDKDEKESESEKKKSKYKSNKELLEHQKIVIPPEIEPEFRFSKIEKRYALVKNNKGAKVYEKKSEDASAVGELDYYGLCYILDDQADGWYYIESGNVRGFLKAEDVAVDEVADRIVAIKGAGDLPVARLLVARSENSAFEYTHTTVQEVLAGKVYALASGEVKIYEQRKSSSNVTGILQDQALCYILADGDKDWVFVESGDVRGFVEQGSLITGNSADARVAEKGEKNMPLAQMLIAPQDNKACYYTLTSVKEGSQAAKTREAMVKFALQFVGNRYIWGGTSLTSGADCSGFVQSIYSYFGYSIPRVAEDQAGYGMQIPISSAEPGDLIFYARNGYVYHVSMYIGNGQVVQAANSNAGIITSGIADDAVWATRVIKD